MKYTISALDLHFLVREFQRLAGAKVEKVYQPDAKDFMLVMHIPGTGRKILRISLPTAVFLTDFKGRVPEQPSQFCVFLRKYLKNARIRKVGQVGFERILRLQLSTKDSELHLYIELFSNGNIILTDGDDIIRGALFTKKYRDRTIRGNARYEYPRKEYNVLKITENEFVEAVRSSGKDSLVAALAIDLGLGGRYAEELCLRAGLDKNKMPKEGLDRLYSELRKLLRQRIRAGYIKGRDIVPVRLKMYAGAEPYATFNDALSDVLTGQLMKAQQEQQEREMNRELNRIKRIIQQQEETIGKLKAQAEDNRRRGELLFENYQVVDDVLKELNRAFRKFSLKEIRARLKGHKVIKKVNEKEVEIEL